MRSLLVSLIFLMSSLYQTQALAQKAVLVEDANGSTPAESEEVGRIVGRDAEEATAEPAAHSKSTAARKFFHEDGQEYNSTYAMRSDRRVGVGAEVVGKMGLLGVDVELNFALDDSAMIGFGGGPQYSSFELGWKHVFGGKTIAPYAGVAYSRWYNNSSSGQISGSTPSFLADKFLNSSQLQSGQFAVNFLIPSAGVQFNMLNGDYVGLSIYAEAMALVSLSDLHNTINGTFGAMYYF